MDRPSCAYFGPREIAPSPFPFPRPRSATVPIQSWHAPSPSTMAPSCSNSTNAPPATLRIDRITPRGTRPPSTTLVRASALIGLQKKSKTPPPTAHPACPHYFTGTTTKTKPAPSPPISRLSLHHQNRPILCAPLMKPVRPSSRTSTAVRATPSQANPHPQTASASITSEENSSQPHCSLTSRTHKRIFPAIQCQTSN